MERKLLVLDLDETLVHAADIQPESPPDSVIASFCLYARPGLGVFFERCGKLFELAVWTVATADYARAVVDAFF